MNREDKAWNAFMRGVKLIGRNFFTLVLFGILLVPVFIKGISNWPNIAVLFAIAIVMDWARRYHKVRPCYKGYQRHLQFGEQFAPLNLLPHQQWWNARNMGTLASFSSRPHEPFQ